MDQQIMQCKVYYDLGFRVLGRQSKEGIGLDGMGLGFMKRKERRSRVGWHGFRVYEEKGKKV